MKRKRILVVVAAGVILLAVLTVLFVRKDGGPKEREKLKVGVTDAAGALIFVGQERGIFKRQGLDLSVKNYQAGLYAINDLVEGKVDVAGCAELVLALQGFKRSDLRALATIASADSTDVIARKDRGINRPEDLRGKRVGVIRNTISDFFLLSFLSFHGVPSIEIQMIDLKPYEIVAAIADGKIDAASCFYPYSDTLRKTLGENSVSWSAQGGQDYYFLLVVRDELIKTRPRAVTGLLKGVLEAETFVKEHDKESMEITARALNLDPAILASYWGRGRFRVRLDQDILTLMEAEARWAIRNKMVDGEKVPNYLNSLYLDGLGKIKPDAVTVIR
jgi:ABC-type nitrate/sulfonate/bicarbonate transport system substrate-binding protein